VRRALIWLAVLVGGGAVGALLVLEISRMGLVRSVTGVVLTANTDPAKQTPIANTRITVSGRTGSATGMSDVSGFFRISLPQGLWRGETVRLSFQRADYRPFEESGRINRNDYVARLEPIPVKPAATPSQPDVVLSDIRVRYLSKGATTTEVGSTVRTFQVINRANVPCEGHSPCSPDNRWRATIWGVKLDAGDGQEFRNTRVSCIAGPCPFTRIENDDYTRGGRVIAIAVRNWSDTTTFLVESEVVRTVAGDMIRQAYPAIFGRVISFTLPANAQGPSFEAEWNGQEITFPLGPDLLLNWADCTLKMEADKARLYSCELKPGYRVKT
jgi:hypothetical protein